MDVTSPHKHRHVIARAHQATADRSGPPRSRRSSSQRDWAALRFEDRAAVFLRAADLLADHVAAPCSTLPPCWARARPPSRPRSTRLRADRLPALQRALRRAALRRAAESSPGVWNRLDYRPLEGFVYAVTPFNFTAIGGNLPSAPALMGNTVVWKPARDGAAQQLLRHASCSRRRGCRPGSSTSCRAIRQVHRDGCWPTGISPASTSPGRRRCSSRSGSRWRANSRATPPIRASWARPAARTSSWRTRARTRMRWRSAMVRGAFEYQGQKCSAASRAYIPRDALAGGARPDARA